MSNYRYPYANNGYRPTSGYRVGAYGDGSYSTAVAAPTPPGTPALWYDAQDLKGLGDSNATQVDGTGVASWSSKGSHAGAAMVQATGSAQPIFRKVATSGKINNLSAVQGDGTQWIQNLAFTTALVQPTMVAMVVRPTDLAGFVILFDGFTARQRIIVTNVTGVINGFAGSSVNYSSAMTAATWATNVMTFNGASSVNRLDGVQSSTANPGANGLDGVQLFSLNGSNIAPAMFAEVLVYDGTLPSAASVEAYFAAKYGATPQ